MAASPATLWFFPYLGLILAASALLIYIVYSACSEASWPPIISTLNVNALVQLMPSAVIAYFHLTPDNDLGAKVGIQLFTILFLVLGQLAILITIRRQTDRLARRAVERPAAEWRDHGSVATLQDVAEHLVDIDVWPSWFSGRKKAKREALVALLNQMLQPTAPRFAPNGFLLPESKRRLLAAGYGLVGVFSFIVYLLIFQSLLVRSFAQAGSAQ